jgi:creatinine amidohydrolase
VPISKKRKDIKVAKKKYLLEHMTWPEAKEAFERTSVIVIPIGSTEQHGPHMPLGTDFLVAQDLARRVGERADVIVTPTITIGYAKYHTTFPGSLSVSQETLARALIEICDDLIRYGATHILFVNGHGGNKVSIGRCGTVLRKRCVPVATACWWEMSQVVNPEWLAIGHADYVETSAILAIDESLANMELAQVPQNKNLSDTIALDTPHIARFKEGALSVNLVPADITDTGDMLEYGLTAATDYETPPTTGTKEMGKAILDGLADYLAEFIEEFRKVELPPLEEMGPLAK